MRFQVHTVPSGPVPGSSPSTGSSQVSYGQMNTEPPSSPVPPTQTPVGVNSPAAKVVQASSAPAHASAVSPPRRTV